MCCRFSESRSSPKTQRPSSEVDGALAALAANSFPIGVHGVTFLGFANPVSPSSFRFGDITANTEHLEIHHRVVTVVTLVGDQFLQPVFGDLCGGLGIVG